MFSVPLALAALVSSAAAASVRDRAELFAPDAVRQAEATLNRIERESKLDTTIETVDSLQGQTVEEASLEHAKRSETHGLYILIAKQEHKIDVRCSRDFVHAFPHSRLSAIREAFTSTFKKGDFDAGLLLAAKTIGTEVSAAKAENGGSLRATNPQRGGVPVRGRPAAGQPGTFGIGSLLGIGLAILAVLFVIRLIGGLAGGGGYGGGAYGGAGRMGAPGYGAPGYGGGGGGFFSSLMGGIGGALAGNWLYDQFSGRHHDAGNYGSNTDNASNYGPQETTGGDDWSGGGSASGDWGGGGGGDWGGGAGGGGDWGGGGGGDWGGGDSGGGGDW